MRYVLFGDESTLLRMQEFLFEADVLSVFAGNRSQSQELQNGSFIVQPFRKSREYPDFLRLVREFNPDAFICFSYSMILCEELLSIPSFGGINIHGGLLPQYRGANVLNWAIIEGATETGVTAHFMTPTIDEGDIVFQKKIPVYEECTALTLKKRLDEVGFDMIVDIHRFLCSGEKLPRKPQDEALARHYKRRHPEDGLIDWNEPEREIHNLIRALVKPWPGAFYYDKNDAKITIDHYLSIDEVSSMKQKING
jgi:methionyl-tRNA formyltransferase